MMTIEQRIRADFPSPVLGVDVLEFLSYRRANSYDGQLLEGYRFIEGDYYVSDFTNVYVYRRFSFPLFPITENSRLLHDYRIVWAETDWFEKNEFALLKRQESLEEARRLRLTIPSKHKYPPGGEAVFEPDNRVKDAPRAGSEFLTFFVQNTNTD